MKFENLTLSPQVITPARLLRLQDAITYVGSETILRLLESRGGLKPFEQRNRLTVYDRLEIDRAIELVKGAS